MGFNRNHLPDLRLTLPLIFLLSLGILVLYSSDVKLAGQQIIIAIISFFIYWFLSLIDFESYNYFVHFLYFLTLSLLVVVFIVGFESRGSIRWIPLGIFNLQPSEFIKPVLILLLAQYWSNHLPNWKNIFVSFLWVAPALLLIFKQPDLGTTLTIGVLWFFMLIGANISNRKLILMGGSILSIAPVVWLFLKDYQKARIFSFLSPDKDPLGIGYNVIQSTIAVGSGQLLGRGLGRGTQSRLQFLPEYQTDFIFASIAEELGFFGSILVLILYGSLFGRCFKILNSANRFGGLIIFGVIGVLFFQVVVNIGMNIGLLPITGITLPLLSYGGSSLVSTLICLGLVASVSRFNLKVRR